MYSIYSVSNINNFFKAFHLHNQRLEINMILNKKDIYKKIYCIILNYKVFVRKLTVSINANGPP